jgi:hypothetical protein
MGTSTAQHIFDAAKARVGIRKPGSIHLLRHHAGSPIMPSRAPPTRVSSQVLRLARRPATARPPQGTGGLEADDQNKQFHDEILRQGSMPIALLRLALTRQTLTRDMNINWPFYGELPAR